MSRWKIICLNDVYKISLGHFLTRCIFYLLILKNAIENKKFNFLTKRCEMQNEPQYQITKNKLECMQRI